METEMCGGEFEVNGAGCTRDCFPAGEFGLECCVSVIE